MFSIKISITTVPYKTFAKKTSTQKHINQHILSQTSWANHEKMGLIQKVITAVMFHRGFIPYIVH